jgi:hypothetical protein
MKGSDKKALGKSILNTGLSFAKGIAGGLNPVVGAVIGAGEGIVKGVQKEKDKNLTSKVGGEGKIDIAHLAGVGVFVLLAAAFAFGLITMEDLKELIKLFLKTQ